MALCASLPTGQTVHVAVFRRKTVAKRTFCPHRQAKITVFEVPLSFIVYNLIIILYYLETLEFFGGEIVRV